MALRAITLGAYHGRGLKCFKAPPGTKVRGKIVKKVCVASSRTGGKGTLSTSVQTIRPFTKADGSKVKGYKRRGGFVVASSVPKSLKGKVTKAGRFTATRHKPKSTAKRKAAQNKFARASKTCGGRGLTRKQHASCVKAFMRTGKLSALANQYQKLSKPKPKRGRRSRGLSGLSGATKRKPKCLKWGKATKGKKRKCMKRAKR